MSVIQKIQDKYGKVMAIIIAFALVIFVVMLAFENGGSLFRGQSMTVGKINGEEISIQNFSTLVEQQTEMMKSRQMGDGEMAAQQANEAAWNQEIMRVLIDQETEKLGITVGKKELNDLLFGTNPPQELKQAFTDPQTGQYNGAVAQQQINEVKSKGTAEQKAQMNSFLDQLVLQHLGEKFDALFSASINFPKWMIEKQNAENALMSKISFVREPYTSISDSAVKVTDADIQAFINKNKKDFKQPESRSISYVAFDAQPSAADSTTAMRNITELKAAFDSTRDIESFLTNQGVNTFYNGYISSNRIQIPMKDSIFRVGVGNIYGPYIDGSSYSLAKVLGAKQIPDTVKIRHILIGLATQDPQSGQQIPLRDTATAKKLADSVALAIRNGANFDSMVVKFSTDPGSVNNGGVYDDVPSGQMVPEFNDFIFGNPVGSRAVVKTDFGYHIIEILSQKGSSTGYKIAYISKPIEASQETDMAANNEATKFAGQAKDQKTFNEAAEKLQKEKGINKAIATDIAPTGSMIQGVGSSRSFVKSIYEADLGDIVQPQRVGNYYVVGLVTEVNKEGTMSAAKARMMVEPLLLNEKKADLITTKIGKVTTLEAAATALKKSVETADSLRFNGQGNPVLGFEPKVIGASFNQANVNKVVPEAIAGSQGVYIIRVDNIMATPVAAANVEQERMMRYQQAKQQTRFAALQALREAATIKDNRNKFY
ncbi:MAG: peptidylprolyl isomerase [Sphingobacteriales bacterium 41-5]|mgnify:CR=1 FL=1|nr:MAG: peptidylprolyl isomerase [Sphingobacteriales bacterium 41-5]